MKWKRFLLVLAVIALAAAAIFVLRAMAAKRAQMNDASPDAPPDTATVQAQDETQSATTAAATGTSAPRETRTLKDETYSFTVSGTKVYATVQGGNGETKIDGEEDIEEILPTAGEFEIAE